MRWTSRALFWGLLATLLVGLVLMHHAPRIDSQHPESPAAPVAAGGAGATMTGQPALDCSCARPEHHVPPAGHDGHSTGLLHLCLAVLAALGGTLAAAMMLRSAIFVADGRTVSPPSRPGLDLRPPVPVPRRLAALCVLRL